jgi:hypothetical protein
MDIIFGFRCKGSNDRGDSILDERGTLEADMKRGPEEQQVSHKNNKPLTKITKRSCKMWAPRPE